MQEHSVKAKQVPTYVIGVYPIQETRWEAN